MNYIIEVATGNLALISREVKIYRERPVFYYLSKLRYIPKRLKLCTFSGNVATNGPPLGVNPC